MAKKKKESYVNNEDLRNEIVEYKVLLAENASLGLPRPQMSDSLGSKILLIAERLSMRPNFYNYSYRDEMVSDGVENCILYIHNFNPEKSDNAFSYITQIIWYAFLRRIAKEKKQSTIKFSCLEQASGLKLYDGNSVSDNIPMRYKDFLGKLQISIMDIEKYTAAKQKKPTTIETKTELVGLNKFMEKK